MLGEYIKKKRELAGIKGTELSLKIGKERSYISQLERGTVRAPDEQTLKKILEIFNAPEEESKTILEEYSRGKKTSYTPVNTSVNKIFRGVMTEEYYNKKCEEDALAIYNMIELLPDKTKQILMDLLTNNTD